MNKKIVAVSGGFDPIHVGHLRMLQEAAKLGSLTVIINSDAWLRQKKGYIFMPWNERAEIISAFECVDNVIEAKDEDRTVCESLKEIQPDIFANGGDRVASNTPESILCKELGIELKYNVGGGKVRSSSHLIDDATTTKRLLDHRKYTKEIAL
jgi:D-beta-D-heptose 7-phosphate kinase/D-beta-D-heptose 1-phosphate adenosyltransferase